MKSVMLLVTLLLLTTVAHARRKRSIYSRSSSSSQSSSRSRSSDNEDELRNCTTGLTDATENGIELSYCQTNSRQCCSNQFFLDRREKLRLELLGSLTNELSVNGDLLDNVINSLRKYLGNRFINRFLGKLNTSYINQPDFVAPLATEFQNNLVIVVGNTFDVSDYVQRIVDGVVTAIIDSLIVPTFGEISDEQRECIVSNLLTSGIQDDIVDSFTLLRRAFTTLVLIDDFYDELERNITAIGYRLSDRCLDAFVNLRCKGCQRVIPRTCRNTCGAIVRGCYAVLFNSLTDELNTLWAVVDQLTSLINTAVDTLQTDSSSLIAADADGLDDLITQIGDTCGLSAPPSSPDARRRRLQRRQDDEETDDETDDDSDVTNDGGDETNDVSDEANDGGDETGDDDQETDDDDQETDDDDQETSRSNSRSGTGVPSGVISNSSALRGAFEYDETGPRYCRSQSNTNCWNGLEVVDVDTTDFTGTSIEDQLNNPIFEFTQADLEEAQELVNSIGSPVTSFLMSRQVQTVAPEGALDLPNTSTDGASLKMASLLVILLAAAVALLLYN